MFSTSRSKQKLKGPPNRFVADLDALLTETVEFKVLGKIHKIPPLSTEQFLNFAKAYEGIDRLKMQETVSPEMLIEKYHEVVASVCSTISKEDIGKMSQQQVAGLFQILVDLYTGKLFADEKKSLQKVQSLLSTRID